MNFLLSTVLWCIVSVLLRVALPELSVGQHFALLSAIMVAGLIVWLDCLRER